MITRKTCSVFFFLHMEKRIETWPREFHIGVCVMLKKTTIWCVLNNLFCRRYLLMVWVAQDVHRMLFIRELNTVDYICRHCLLIYLFVLYSIWRLFLILSMHCLHIHALWFRNYCACNWWNM